MAPESSPGTRGGSRDSSLLSLSSHILPTSATMVGVCMTVLSIGRLTNAGRLGVLIDKLLAADALLFLFSAVLSFLSIRVTRRARRMEGWAEILFLLGLILITLAAIMIALAFDQ